MNETPSGYKWKKKWMELCPHPIKTVVINPVALLLGFIFHALLLIEYCGDKLKRSLDETSFVNRHIFNSVLKVETN